MARQLTEKQQKFLDVQARDQSVFAQPLAPP